MSYLDRLRSHSPAVEAQFRPTLPELLAPRFAKLPRAVRILTLAAFVLLIALFVLRTVNRLGTEPRYVQEGALPFNFRYANGLKPVAPDRKDGTYVKLERRRGKLFLESFSVEPLALPPFVGEATGALPSYATRHIQQIASRYRQFSLVEEGRARVNQVPGYTVVFRARLGKRALYGRDVFLPEPVPGSRRGVVIRMVATPAAGVYAPGMVGSLGAGKLPYRSFRFGSSAP